MSESDRADARAYVAAAKRFNRLAPALIRAAATKTAASFYECTLVRLGVPELPPVSELRVVSVIAYYRALLPLYRTYALRLKSIHAQDATLRDVAQAAVDLVRRYGEVNRTRPEYCHALRAWQAAGWRKDFSVLRAIGVSEKTFDQNGAPRDAGLSGAEATIATSGLRLRQLGVVQPDVRAFLLATDVFAAGRGGYAEIERLTRG